MNQVAARFLKKSETTSQFFFPKLTGINLFYWFLKTIKMYHIFFSLSEILAVLG